MQAFEWDHRFETGLPTVDQQHHHLVDLVNLAGDILLAGTSSEEELQNLFAQLADYAIYHFNEEERLMAETAVDPRHVEPHKFQHAEFLKQVTMMWNSRALAENPAAMLHGFLSLWLTVHILGQDQEMARNIARIRAGETPAAAFDAESETEDNRITPLLDALERLYILLSTQNRELANANTTLEQKVQERTKALEDASKQLLQSEKLASLGRMVAGFAHEVNTPVGIALGAISQNDDVLQHLLEMMKQEEVSEEEFSANLATLQEAGKLAVSNLMRAAELVRSFKRTSIDQASEQSRAFNMKQLISDVQTNLHNEFKRTQIRILIDCPETLNINGAPGLLHQLLTNLMLNSLQHAFDEGKRAGEISITVTLLPANRLHLSFADTGAGMPPEIAAKIFEPFFTTRRGQGGSGLGLYICYNIVTTQLNGSITCHSAPEQGSRFDIELPYIPAATADGATQ